MTQTMKAMLGTFLGVLGAWGAWCGLALQAAAQQGGGMFQLEVCNWSPYHAKIALQARPYPGALFETSGWYDAPPGRCSFIGNYAMGPLDLYADALNSGGKFWDGLNNGGTIRACLAYPGPFKRVNYDNTPCRSDEVSKLMQSTNVSSSRFTWNLH